MTIKRNECTFELTEQELIDAYFEQQQKFDEEDAASVLDDFTDEEFSEVYKITKEEFKKLIPEIADAMRKNMDKYCMPFSEARGYAIDSVIERHSL